MKRRGLIAIKIGAIRLINRCIMSQQSYQNNVNEHVASKKIANLSVAIFYLVSSLFLVVLLTMFIFVWQPIWSNGFKDFHRISNAIHQLDETTKPATDAIPTMLKEMTQMNQSMTSMVEIMKDMDQSVALIGEMTPAIKSMSSKIEYMTYLMSQIDSKLPATNRIPFWSN